MNAIKSVIKNSPSVCASGIKISKRLCSQLREHLKMEINEDAEIDGIYFYPSGDKLNIMFGECKVIIGKSLNQFLFPFSYLQEINKSNVYNSTMFTCLVPTY